MEDFTKEIKDYYAREIKVIEDPRRRRAQQGDELPPRALRERGDDLRLRERRLSATASHMVCDFNKGTCANVEKRFRFVCLNDNIPTLMAVANDMAFEDVFYYQLENKLRKGDLILAISGSGNSHNVIKAVEYAKKVGCQVIGMTGYDGGKLAKLSDFQLHVPADDMQITEDLHMGFDHMMMQIFWKYLETRAGLKPEYKINK
jgi:D-sedoheptulose 7-phosphate isomerase